MNDLYQTVTDRIVAEIERGAGNFLMPWHSRPGATELQLPRNVTGRPYRGVNVPILWATAETYGYDTPVWATYKRWLERGAQVRKGEKATMVVFWKSVEKAHKTEAGDKETGRRLIARGYFVFNASQVDGPSGTTGKRSSPPRSRRRPPSTTCRHCRPPGNGPLRDSL